MLSNLPWNNEQQIRGQLTPTSWHKVLQHFEEASFMDIRCSPITPKTIIVLLTH